MSTITQPTGIADLEEVTPFLCHVYDLLSLEIAKCGLHITSDTHKQMHTEHGHDWRPKLSEQTVCDICGAPICGVCLKFCR